MTPPVSFAAENDGGLSEHVIDTVSPSHVTFNLFDYWANEKGSSYNNGWGIQKGINVGHILLFNGNQSYAVGPWNSWTGKPGHDINGDDKPGVAYGEYRGIVKNTLSGGYPTLDLQDESYSPPFMTGSGQKEESLAYLFDTNAYTPYRTVYENVQGLVKYNGEGGYVYNSHENYAAFQEATSGTVGTNGEASDGYFDVYDSWALTSGGSPSGQFFPPHFDGAGEVFKKTNGAYEVDDEGLLVPKTDVKLAGNTTLNHYFGMTMETLFLQPEDGKIDADTPMSFSFSGDDDVWIFIDDVLVSDLGGIHDECFTVIDFESGMVYTGLTPTIRNSDGSFTEDIPTLEELKTGTPEQGGGGTWYNRSSKQPA